MTDSSKPRTVTVLGGGVSGLTTAIRLAEAGHTVRVVADRYLRDTTSWIATAIWHVFWVSLNDRVVGWAADTLKELLALSDDSATGVTRIRGLECLRSTAPQTDLVHGGAEDFWRAAVPYYRSLTRQDVVNRLPKDYPTDTIIGGYLIEVPIADMSVYLPYLMARLRSLGVVLETSHIDTLEHLRNDYPADFYVNCSGLGARELTKDEQLSGVKGQVVRVSRGTLNEYIADDFSPRGMTYVLPRGTDIILGGSEDEGVENADVDRAFGREILERCVRLVPELAEHEVLEDLAGVRPYRRGSVRLESDEMYADVIHNYGHGGSGVSLSWGCADEVTSMVSSIPLEDVA